MAAVGQAMQGGKSWAKARLTRGQSTGGVWEIDQQYPQARLAIGSDASAGWSIQAPGVRPMHFELYWDGKCLFVADTQRAGGVTLNGAPLATEWTQVRGRGEVVFGQATLAIETSESHASGTPDAVSAHRVSPAEGPSAMHNLADLTGEATRMTDSPVWQPMEGEATRIQESALDAMPPPPPPPPPPKMGAPPSGPQRPRLGGSGDAVVAPPAKTLMQGELGHALGEATRMVSMPDHTSPPSIVLAPGMGMPPPPPMQHQHQHQHQQQSMMGGPPQVSPPPQSPFGAPMAPTGPGGFAAPPGFGEAPPPARPVGGAFKLPFGLTPVKAALIGGLVLAVMVLGVVGLSDDDAESVPDQQAVAPPTVAPPQTRAPPPTAGYVPPPNVVPGYPPTYVPPPTGAYVPPPTYAPPPSYAPPPTGAYVPPPPTYVPPYPPPATAVAPPATAVAPAGPTPERVAADQVLAGRYSDALPLYRALAMEHPERPEYPAMVHILEQRIRAAQCVNGIGPDGRPCVPTGRP